MKVLLKREYFLLNHSLDGKLIIFSQKICFNISCKLFPLHEILKPIFWEKIHKIFQNVVCWYFYPTVCAVILTTTYLLQRTCVCKLLSLYLFFRNYVIFTCSSKSQLICYSIQYALNDFPVLPDKTHLHCSDKTRLVYTNYMYLYLIAKQQSNIFNSGITLTSAITT